MGKKTKYHYATADEYAQKLTEADNAYEDGTPLMSDPEYDHLRDEFQERFPKHKYFSKVGGGTSNLPKVKHQMLMGSQNKVKTYEELVKWAKNQSKKIAKEMNLDKIYFLASEKIDGTSLSLVYEKGLLVTAATRGGGDYGDDVTQNVKKMKLVPTKLKKPVNVVVRGEGIIFDADFAKYFPEAANSRNSAAGSVRRLDGAGCEHISFLAYDLSASELTLNSELDKFETLIDLGFTTPEYIHTDSFEEVERWYQQYEATRDRRQYQMDGLVVCFSDLRIQKLLKVVNNRPGYSRAYKFSAESGISKLEVVHWQVGRTGTVTPVGQITPVKIAGAMITNVSLHNLAIMKKLGLKIGQTVEVERAGDVIPKVVKVVKPAGTEIKIPTACPSCGEKLTAEEIFLVCTNHSGCPEQQYQTLLHWVTTLDIKGFGDELVKQLIAAKLVASPVDFYKLKQADIAQLERRGEKSAEKVLKNLHAKKQLTIPEFVKALGIDGVGATIAGLAQVNYPTLAQLRTAAAEDLAQIHGIGEITAQALVAGLRTRKKLIDKLLTVVEVLAYQPAVPRTGPLVGQSFCFTGVRDKDLEKRLTELGANIVDGVSKHLTYLVAKDVNGESNKIVKARSLGLQVITLEQARKLGV